MSGLVLEPQALQEVAWQESDSNKTTTSMQSKVLATAGSQQLPQENKGAQQSVFFEPESVMQRSAAV